MSIWFSPLTIERINSGMTHDHMGTFLGIKITEVGDDYLKATMPVNERTKQPYGIMHGGASCVLAETIGSVGAYYTLDHSKQFAVGLDINTSHIRSVRHGVVTGTGIPINIGSRIQVWQIRVVDEEERLISLSRLTVSILDHRPA